MSQFNPGGPIAGQTNQQIENEISLAQRQALTRIHPGKSGQITSFASFDDGYFQHGNGPAFLTLGPGVTNPFGNNNRFTDENGLQVYTNNYVIDWLRGYGWTKELQPTATWAVAVAQYGVFSRLGHTDFFLPNVVELLNLMNWFSAALNFAPFNLNPGASAQVWASTTNFSSTTTAIRVGYQSIPQPTTTPKVGSQPYLLCRILT